MKFTFLSAFTPFILTHINLHWNKTVLIFAVMFLRYKDVLFYKKESEIDLFVIIV